MNYADKEAMCRVDFFHATKDGRPRKWYTTEAVEFLTYRASEKLLEESFREALDAHFGDTGRLKGMLAVCLEPWHEYRCPITTIV